MYLYKINGTKRITPQNPAENINPDCIKRLPLHIIVDKNSIFDDNYFTLSLFDLAHLRRPPDTPENRHWPPEVLRTNK